MGSQLVTIFILLCLAIPHLVKSQDIVQRRTPNICQKDADCPDNAFCKQSSSNGYCSCKENYIIIQYNNTHRECLKEASTLGDICKVDLQCQTKLSVQTECVEGRCLCKKQAHFKDGKCYETAKIGERCMVHQNCYLEENPNDEAFCIKGECQCNFFYSPRDNGTRCLKDALLGDECEDSEHCVSEFTRCEGVCRCEQGFVVHPDEKRCLRVASYGEKCEIESQCTELLSDSICLGGECICDYDYHYIKGKCYPSRYEGEKCTIAEECIDPENTPGGKMLCNGVCYCRGCRSTSPSSSSSSSSLTPTTSSSLPGHIITSSLVIISILTSIINKL